MRPNSEGSSARDARGANSSRRARQSGAHHGADVVQLGDRADPIATTSHNPSVNDLIEAYQEVGRPRFAHLRRAYEERNGEIVEDYFARSVHAAALLVEKPRRGRFRGLRRRTYRIALAHDSSRATPDLDEAVRTVQREERQSAILLSGRSGQILSETAYLLIVYLLRTMDGWNREQFSERSASKRIASVVASTRRDLAKMEQFTHRSARRTALHYYLTGLPIGAILGILLVVEVFRSQVVGQIANTDLVSFCLASGAIGAVISVMVRINRGASLEVDFDRGRAVTMLAGSFRPIIGAVFGGVLYVLVLAGLLPLQVPMTDTIGVGPDAQASFFFIGLAFLAGFSERWAQDTIVNSAPRFPAARSPKPLSDPDDGTTLDASRIDVRDF